jgi:hypothetical protein
MTAPASGVVMVTTKGRRGRALVNAYLLTGRAPSLTERHGTDRHGTDRHQLGGNRRRWLGVGERRVDRRRPVRWRRRLGVGMLGVGMLGGVLGFGSDSQR